MSDSTKPTTPEPLTNRSTVQGFQGQRYDALNGGMVYRYRTSDGVDHDVRISRDDLKRLLTSGDIADYVSKVIANGQSEVVS